MPSTGARESPLILLSLISAASEPCRQSQASPVGSDIILSLNSVPSIEGETKNVYGSDAINTQGGHQQITLYSCYLISERFDRKVRPVYRDKTMNFAFACLFKTQIKSLIVHLQMVHHQLYLFSRSGDIYNVHNVYVICIKCFKCITVLQTFRDV